MKKALVGLILLAALAGLIYVNVKPKRPNDLAGFYSRIHPGMSVSEVLWQLGEEPDRRVEATRFGNVPLVWERDLGWKGVNPELLKDDRFLVRYFYTLPDETDFVVEFDKDTQKVSKLTDSVKVRQAMDAENQRFIDSMGGPDKLRDLLQRTKPKDKKAP